MNAGDWVGWLIISLMVLSFVAISVGKIAADIEPICRWLALKFARANRWIHYRIFALRNAEVLVKSARSQPAREAERAIEHARQRHVIETIRRENGRLEREVWRLQERERSDGTAIDPRRPSSR